MGTMFGIALGTMLWCLGGLFVTAICLDKSAKSTVRFMYMLVLFILCFAQFDLNNPPAEEDTTYFLHAEIVAANSGWTFFGCEDGNIYAADANPDWPDTVPYMLCMDSMGTEENEDDEILVVWRTD